LKLLREHSRIGTKGKIMGIKFRDKTAVGTPTSGEVKTRELLLDLKNSSLYSSTDGTDLIKLGGSSSDSNMDGGSASSVYLLSQTVDGGNA